MRYTLIVLLIFVALAAFAYTLRDSESRQVGPGAPTATPQAILDLDAAAIEEVHVLGPTGGYTLTRVAGGWEVDDQPASTEVDGVITTLAKPTVLRTLPDDRNPDDYGFATPSLTVTLKLAGGEAHVIVVGDDAAAEPQSFVRMGNTGPIALISNYDFERLKEWLTTPPLAPTATPSGEASPGAFGITPLEGTAATDATVAPPGEATEATAAVTESADGTATTVPTGSPKPTESAATATP